MPKRKKRNQKQEIQELMDSIARSESEYLRRQQGRNPSDTNHTPKHVPLYVGFNTHDSKSHTVETEEESALKEAVYTFSTIVENALKAIEVIRDGKLAVDERLAESGGRKGISEKAVNSEPPKSAEYLAYLVLPKYDREILLGDLTEEYPSVVAKFGQREAQFYFYKQVVWSIWPLARKAFIKWGLFGWLVELIRRISS
jgi:hypothetical protein